MADGLFMTPEMARQASMERGMLSSAQMAQLPLLNQVAAMGGNAGTMIGSGLNGLLGGRSAFELENEARMQAYQQQQAAEAEKLRQEQAYKNLQQQKLVQDMGISAAQELRAQTPELSTFGKLIKEQANYKPGTPGYQAYAKKIEKEFATTAKKDPAVGAKAELAAQTKFNKPFGDLTSDEKAQVYKLVTEDENKNSLGAGLGALAEAIVKSTGKEVGQNVAEAASPVVIQGKENTLSALRRARGLIDAEGGIYTGGLANAKMAVSKYTPLGSQKTLENTEKYLAYVSTTVIPLLKEFGGNDSNEELKFLQRLVGGEITLEEDTLKEIIDSAITKTERGIKRVQGAVQSVSEGKMPSTDVTPQNYGTQQTGKSVTLSDGTVVTVRKKGG